MYGNPVSGLELSAQAQPVPGHWAQGPAQGQLGLGLGFGPGPGPTQKEERGSAEGGGNQKPIFRQNFVK